MPSDAFKSPWAHLAAQQRESARRCRELRNRLRNDFRGLQQESFERYALWHEQEGESNGDSVDNLATPTSVRLPVASSPWILDKLPQSSRLIESRAYSGASPPLANSGLVYQFQLRGAFAIVEVEVLLSESIIRLQSLALTELPELYLSFDGYQLLFRQREGQKIFEYKAAGSELEDILGELERADLSIEILGLPSVG